MLHGPVGFAIVGLMSHGSQIRPQIGSRQKQQKRVPCVNIIAKMDTQNILVEKYMRHLWIEK